MDFHIPGAAVTDVYLQMHLHAPSKDQKSKDLRLRVFKSSSWTIQPGGKIARSTLAWLAGSKQSRWLKGHRKVLNLIDNQQVLLGPKHNCLLDAF